MFTTSGFDEFGNPIGRAFDLGGIDDERLRGEKIVLYVGYIAEAYEWHHAQQAISERQMQMDVVMAPGSGKCSLTPQHLSEYSQLWYVSDRTPTLSSQQVRMIADYVRSGNGLLIWADNDPYFADANLLAETLIGTHFSGDVLGDGIMVPGESVRPGYFVDHPLTQGVNNLYEGITICTIAPAPHLTILAQSHDGQMCMACYEKESRRIVLDTGFTKLHPGAFYKTAGTARYFRNIAFWLARGSRNIQYTSFTPGRESIATIKEGETSAHYKYTLKEPEKLTYLLHWEGAGKLGLVVQDPQGHIVYDLVSAKPPIRAETSASLAGDWVCWVKGIQIPSSNFPYVLTLAHSSLANVPLVVKPTRTPQKRQGPAYTRPWSSTQPGCLIVLLDQSSSMNEVFGVSQVGAGRKKCDMVATVLNSLLLEFVKTNTVGMQIKPRAEIAVLAYEGGSVRSALGGTLANKSFVSLPELMANPLRIERRTKKEVDDAGTITEVSVDFPVWVEPLVGTATPMCAALEKARQLAEEWTTQHPDSYPPVVINITDGASTDGDPALAAQQLRQVTTNDGELLLFNVYLTSKGLPMVEYPSSEKEVPDDGEGFVSQLWKMSSEVPETARRGIHNATGRSLLLGSRGLIVNGDAGSVRQMFVFATIGATRIDPNR